MRGFLYHLARLIGDYTAIKKQKVMPRIKRRLTGYAIGKFLLRRIK